MAETSINGQINHSLYITNCSHFILPFTAFKLEVAAPAADPWGPWEMCPYDSAVVNYALYYKEDQGASGIRLQCDGTPLAATSTIELGSERTQVTPTPCANGINGARAVKNDVVVSRGV